MEPHDQLSLSLISQPPHNENPYAIYRQLRELDPVYWDPVLEHWVLTRHSDIVSVLRDTRFTAQRFMMDTSWLPAEFADTLGPAILALTRQMLFLDPPDHTRLRSLVSKAFTPRVIDALRPRVQQIVDELLDQVQPNGRMEVLGDFAFPLPAIVIAEMLGVPPEDREQFVVWTSDFGSLLSSANLTLEGIIKALNGVAEFIAYFRGIIASRRTTPRDDLLQAMINAEEQGDRLTEEELLGNCVLLLAAGHGTTLELIGNGLHALLRHPDQLQDLKENPAIVSTAVSELLRYDGPVQATSRIAKVDLEIGGKRIEAGQGIYLVLGAASRDPEVFVEPDRLNLRRQENRHLAFAHGIHFCLGAPLARIEGEIAFNTLVRRLKSPRFTAEKPQWGTDLVFRGLNALPIEFDA